MSTQAQPTPHSKKDPILTMHSNIEQWQAVRSPRKVMQERALRAVNNEQKFKEFIAPIIAAIAPYICIGLVALSVGVFYKACTTPQASVKTTVSK